MSEMEIDLPLLTELDKQEIEKNINDHKDMLVSSDSGVHGLRYSSSEKKLFATNCDGQEEEIQIGSSDDVKGIISNDWNAEEEYAAGRIRLHNNKAWKCKIGNRGQEPVTGSAYWEETDIEKELFKLNSDMFPVIGTPIGHTSLSLNVSKYVVFGKMVYLYIGIVINEDLPSGYTKILTGIPYANQFRPSWIPATSKDGTHVEFYLSDGGNIAISQGDAARCKGKQMYGQIMYSII